MSHHSFHSRTLKKRREIRHECLSWLKRNWVYTISCLLTHLSYTNRNTCNSASWTIWLKWCFLRSKRFYHLSWTRFELVSCCNFSSFFLKFAFNELRKLVSFSTRVRRDLAQQKRRFWDFSEWHFQISFLSRTSFERKSASKRYLDCCCKHCQNHAWLARK
jgi:hypothetical protein